MGSKMINLKVCIALCMLIAAASAVECDVVKNGALAKVFYGLAPPGFQEPDFNDKSWRYGTFPFGSCRTCDELEDKRPFSFFGGNAQMNLRFVLNLNKPVDTGAVHIRVGNRASVYVNGVWIGDVNNGPCNAAEGGFPSVRRGIRAGLLRNGRNVIAVRAIATTGNAYLSLDVKVDADDCNKVAELTCKAIKNKKTSVLYLNGGQPRPNDWKEIDANEDDYVPAKFPLGDNVRCQQLKCNPLGGPFPNNTKVITRNKFILRRIPQTVRVRVITDNFATVTFNGESIGFQEIKSCSQGSLGKLLKVPPRLLLEGINVVAVTAKDRGRQSYLDVEVFVTANSCVAATLPALSCTNVFSNVRCNALAKDGKCTRPFVFRNCQKVCSGECSPCENIFADGRCRTLKSENMCSRPYVMRNCRKTCDDNCEPEDQCRGRCRRKEACMEREGVFHCVDCGIFARRKAGGGLQTCCTTNFEKNKCVSVKSLDDKCMRDDVIKLDDLTRTDARFVRDDGTFCDFFPDFFRNGATFVARRT